MAFVLKAGVIFAMGSVGIVSIVFAVATESSACHVQNSHAAHRRMHNIVTAYEYYCGCGA
jgi:hypothetical protein